jgi:DNA-binding beta-propeller fold protein YncE
VDSVHHLVFVTLAGSGKLLSFSDVDCHAGRTSGCTTGRHSLTLTTAAGSLGGVAVDPTTRTVYVTGSGSNKIYVVKESPLALAKSFSAGGTDPYSITVDTAANRVWWGNIGSNDVGAVNGSTCDAASVGSCAVLGPVEVGGEPAGVVADHAAGKLFVTNFVDDTVSVVSLTSLGIVATLDVSPFVTEPYGAVVAPDGAHVVIAGAQAGTRTNGPSDLVIATATDTATGVLGRTGGNPTELATDAGQQLIVETDDQTDVAAFLPTGLAVDDPSAQPYVTSVGGTDLTALGPKPTESVWNQDFNTGCGCEEGAGTGGISSTWTMPSWQVAPGVVNSYSSRTPCAATSGHCREMPDVSADPTHGYVIFQAGRWTSTGGTSAATPLWAAMTGVMAGSVRNGLLNPTLYRIANLELAGYDDVTTGTNDYTGTHNGAYPATKGYDQGSGLGTPVATSLLSHVD